MGKKHKAGKAARAAERLIAREIEGLQARAYDGAKVGRRGDGFTGGLSSANVEVGTALARLRNRSRDLARNTADGRRVLDIKTAHTIGTGIIAVPDNGSDRIDNQVKDLWSEWCEGADVEGVNTFEGLQRLAYMGMLEGGEMLIRRITRRPEGGSRVPLKLKLLEGDFLDTHRDLGMFEGRNSRLGVGLGPEDERLGYWLHAQHPGEFSFFGAPYVSTFVPASEVAHLYSPTRAHQVRGVPVFAPVLMTARDLADLMDAVLVKARTEACFSAFVTRKGSAPTSMGQVQKDAANPKRQIERLAPGMINYLDPDESVEFAEPTSSGQFETVWLAGKMAFAAGVGITHDALTGDLRQANYSSLRKGTIEARRLTAQEQMHVIVPQMMRRVAGWFVDAAIVGGLLKPRRQGYRWDYIMPAVEPIDPKKDLEADILAVRSGRMTPQEFIASWGQDWRKVVADFSAFFSLLDKSSAGLVLDIDPRRTSQTGAAQGAAEGYASDPPKAA